MKKVYIESNGCAVLRHETYKISKYVELNNFEEISNPQEADYIIYTGCGVIESNENYAVEAIKRLYNENKDHAVIIVTGCIPTISSTKIKNISNSIIQIDNENMNKLDDYFFKKVRLNEVYYNINPKRHHSFGDPEIIVTKDEIDDLEFVKKIGKICKSDRCLEQLNYSTRGRHLWKEEDLFEIRVSYGCTGNCSYCITKKAIGKFRSVNQDFIISQAKLAKKQGYSRIILMGDEIGAWNNKGKNIVDLIEAILKVDKYFKIGIRYMQPDILVKYYDRFKPLLATGCIYYFCTALQSGSERILKLMNRNPDISKFIDCMKDIRKNKYPVFVHTQIIVGFPTENDEDVLKTMYALQQMRFDYITVSAYSKREGTKSYKLPEISKEDMEFRMSIFKNLLKLNRDSIIYTTLRDESNKKGNV